MNSGPDRVDPHSGRRGFWGVLPLLVLVVGVVVLFLAPPFGILIALGILTLSVVLFFVFAGWRVGVASLIGVYVFFVFGWAPFFFGGFSTRHRYVYPDKENFGLTPASFQIPFDEAAFTASDGVNLKGWWVGAPEDRGTVILVHGLNRSRIEMVKKVPFVHGLGWNALLFDLRHHGESGGDATTFGFLEKNDVKGAIAFARTHSKGPVVLWGVSLGAATVMLEAAADPSVAAVVCDSSYLSLKDTVPHHLILFRRFAPWLRIVPVWPVADEVLFWIGERGGFPPDKVDIQDAAAHLAGKPLLFVACSGDRRMPKEIAFELQAAAGKDAQVLVVPGESHGGAYRDGTAAYQSAVTKVLEEARDRAPVESARMMTLP